MHERPSDLAIDKLVRDLLMRYAEKGWASLPWADRRLLERLEQGWPEIAAQIEPVLLTEDELERQDLTSEIARLQAKLDAKDRRKAARAASRA